MTRKFIPLAAFALWALQASAALSEPNNVPGERTYYPDGTYSMPGDPTNSTLSGRVELRGANIQTPVAAGSSNTGSLRGSIAASVNSNIFVQADAHYDRLLNADASVSGAEVHASYRQPDSYAVGAFAGYESGTIFNATADVGVYGVEAALFSDRASLLGKAGMTTESTDVYNLAAEARIYATDNLRFDASISRLGSYNANLGLTRYGLEANYRTAQVPTTFFAGYAQHRLDLLGQSAAATHTVFGGARVSFGSSSLKDEERNGAMWTSTAEFLP